MQLDDKHTYTRMTEKNKLNVAPKILNREVGCSADILILFHNISAYKYVGPAEANQIQDGYLNSLHGLAARLHL